MGNERAPTSTCERAELEEDLSSGISYFEGDLCHHEESVQCEPLAASRPCTRETALSLKN